MNANAHVLVSFKGLSYPISSDNVLEDEHGNLRGQIEQLKTSLEHAQMERRRKIEYDAVTEKVNTLLSRQELEKYVILANVWITISYHYLQGDT